MDVFALKALIVTSSVLRALMLRLSGGVNGAWMSRNVWLARDECGRVGWSGVEGHGMARLGEEREGRRRCVVTRVDVGGRSGEEEDAAAEYVVFGRTSFAGADFLDIWASLFLVDLSGEDVGAPRNAGWISAGKMGDVGRSTGCAVSSLSAGSWGGEEPTLESFMLDSEVCFLCAFFFSSFKLDSDDCFECVFTVAIAVVLGDTERERARSSLA